MRLSDLVGIPYDENKFDCVDLMLLVQSRLFGRDFDLPDDRRIARRKSREFLRNNTELRTGSPRTGDLVLMKELGQKWPRHVGTYFFLDGEGWVLHTTEKTCSVFHRVRQVCDYGIIIEGYYQWKPKS